MLSEKVCRLRKIEACSDIYNVHFDMGFMDKPVTQLFERAKQIGRRQTDEIGRFHNARLGQEFRQKHVAEMIFDPLGAAGKPARCHRTDLERPPPFFRLVQIETA